MRSDDGCGQLLPAGNSQNASGVLKARGVERHRGIHDVALRGTSFHGRRSAFGVRHRRLVDVVRGLFLGWIADVDGVIASVFGRRGHSNRNRGERWRSKTQPHVHRSSLNCRSSAVAHTRWGSVCLRRSRVVRGECSIPIGPNCTTCADPARDGGRSMASPAAAGKTSRFEAIEASGAAP